MPEIELEPFTTSDNEYYVKVNGEIVASIVRVADGQWRPSNGVDLYDNTLMAAFADANLSDPAYWTDGE